VSAAAARGARDRSVRAFHVGSRGRLRSRLALGARWGLRGIARGPNGTHSGARRGAGGRFSAAGGRRVAIAVRGLALGAVAACASDAAGLGILRQRPRECHHRKHQRGGPVREHRVTLWTCSMACSVFVRRELVLPAGGRSARRSGLKSLCLLCEEILRVASRIQPCSESTPPSTCSKSKPSEN